MIEEDDKESLDFKLRYLNNVLVKLNEVVLEIEATKIFDEYNSEMQLSYYYSTKAKQNVENAYIDLKDKKREFDEQNIFTRSPRC